MVRLARKDSWEVYAKTTKGSEVAVSVSDCSIHGISDLIIPSKNHATISRGTLNIEA